jgi:hypothetical protein
MTDQEKIQALRQHIDSRLDYLERLIYDHRCNIPEPTMAEQYDYAAACGEFAALKAISAMLDS